MIYMKRKYQKLEDGESSDEGSSKDKSLLDIDTISRFIKNNNKEVYSNDNHIIFNGSINKRNIYSLRDELYGLNKKFILLQQKIDGIATLNPKPIYLHINSYGGYLDDAWAGVDFIQSSKIPVYTVIEGKVASAATLLSIAGKRRYMTKNSHMLIHQLSGGTWGKFSEMEDDMENSKESMEQIIKIYVDKTNMTKTEIQKQLKYDRWWNFDQCKSKGLIDLLWTG